MTPDAPEYHTKTLSPLSPLPIHPPEPSNIPVLQNQIDPILNMTSTFESAPAIPGPADSSRQPNPTADSPSADSSFSDAYKQTDGNEGNKNEALNQGTEASDDYAMTFDSDGEASSDSQDVSQANIDQKPTSIPASVPASQLPSSVSHDSHITDLSQNLQDNTIPDSNSSAVHPPTATAKPSESDPDPTQTEAAKPQTRTYEDIASGGIDIQQLLDNITANAEKNEATSTLTTPSSATAPSFPKTSGLPPHSSLPPRPQLPAKRFHDDIHKYHAGASQPSHTYRPPGMSIVASGAPGTSTDPRSGLPPPPTASFRSPQSAGSPMSPGLYQKVDRLTAQDRKSYESQAEIDDANARWGPEMQKKYDEFLVRERQHVTEGMWGNFPINSRLFIGNLPSEKVTKRDVFHIFHKYGELAQIAIKQAYGFVQFNTAEACFAALEHEQGAVIRDKKMHLEISKPQKNTRNAQGGGAAPAQRTRSPDYGRGGASDRSSRQAQGRAPDRYDARPAYRKDEYGRPLRDDYRPPPTGRPASPLQDHIRNYDYTYNRPSRDSYDGRARRRSRSRSPSYGQRDQYRQRSPSPRAHQLNEDAELQMPRRAPYDVPDVQIILMDQLDHQFVVWVENELRGRGIKSETIFLSPRLSLEAVIRRQILEGVHAVSQLDMRAQNSSKIPLQVFDRQAGNNNVRFNEYQDLEPKIAAELVLRAKQTQAPTPTYAQPPIPSYAPPQPTYTQPQVPAYAPPQPQYPPPQQYQQPPAIPAAPDLANLVGQLDNATLQKLLGSMSAPQQLQNVPAAAANSSIDLAGLLSGLKPQGQPQQAYQPQPPALVPADSYAGYQNGAPQQQVPPQSAQQVQNIMAQLAKFRQ